MKKILISVAPVGAAEHDYDPRAVARDVAACYQNGAAMVHLHSRDRRGRLCADTALLEETVRYIRQDCPDMIIEISTGGVSDLTIEERCQTCLPPWVEVNSLNVGSVNLGDAVYKNPIKDVEYCVGQILGHGRLPDVEVFELGMINTTRELDEQFHFARPLLFALVFGHRGEMPATPASLDHMVSALAENFPDGKYLWGYTQARRQDWEMVKTALDKGAHAVRVGFEDSDMIPPGIHCEDNARIIADLAEVLHEKGMMPMPPAEARKMLGLPGRG